jgi:hypothetical protein
MTSAISAKIDEIEKQRKQCQHVYNLFIEIFEKGCPLEKKHLFGQVARLYRLVPAIFRQVFLDIFYIGASSDKGTDSRERALQSIKMYRCDKDEYWTTTFLPMCQPTASFEPMRYEVVALGEDAPKSAIDSELAAKYKEVMASYKKDGHKGTVPYDKKTYYPHVRVEALIQASEPVDKDKEKQFRLRTSNQQIHMGTAMFLLGHSTKLFGVDPSHLPTFEEFDDVAFTMETNMPSVVDSATSELLKYTDAYLEIVKFVLRKQSGLEPSANKNRDKDIFAKNVYNFNKDTMELWCRMVSNNVLTEIQLNAENIARTEARQKGWTCEQYLKEAKKEFIYFGEQFSWTPPTRCLIYELLSEDGKKKALQDVKKTTKKV